MVSNEALRAPLEQRKQLKNQVRPGEWQALFWLLDRVDPFYKG